MGDRILFQVVSSRDWDKAEFGPVIYGHWSGSAATNICQRLRERMKTRPGDVQYTSARLMQELIGDDNGNTGFGMWNADAVLTASDSHGDAGVVLVVTGPDSLEFESFGGYLEDYNWGRI